jgi:hypothetical protein
MSRCLSNLPIRPPVVGMLSGRSGSGSKESLASSIEAAQRADTIVYAIYFKGRETAGGSNQNPGRQGGGGFPGGRGGGGDQEGMDPWRAQGD